MLKNKVKFVIEDIECSQKVVVNRNNQKIKIKAHKGYCTDFKGTTLAELKDTGNEVIVNLQDMDESIYLDYSQLDYLRKLLNVWEDYFNVQGKYYESDWENTYE